MQQFDVVTLTRVHCESSSARSVGGSYSFALSPGLINFESLWSPEDVGPLSRPENDTSFCFIDDVESWVKNKTKKQSLFIDGNKANTTQGQKLLSGCLCCFRAVKFP